MVWKEVKRNWEVKWGLVWELTSSGKAWNILLKVQHSQAPCTSSRPLLWNVLLRAGIHVVHTYNPCTGTHTHTHTPLCLVIDWAQRIWQSAWPMAECRACSHCFPGVPVQTQVRVSADSNFIPGWWRRLTEQQGGCYFGSLRGSGLYKAHCCDLHCFVAVSHSCAFCHNMSSVQTFTHTPWSSWGMRREVCAGGVCVCVCVCVCTLLPAHWGRRPAYTPGRGDCTWRRFVFEGNGKIFLMEEREFSVLWALGQSVFVRWCCGSAVGMAIRIASISVTLFILKEPKSFINYTQTVLPLNGRDFFPLELGASS